MTKCCPALAVAVILSAPGSVMAAPQKSPEQMLKELGGSVIRGVDYDICFPADAQEYAALGKHAIVRLSASTAIETELPLRSAYLEVKGVRVPLHRLALLDPHHHRRDTDDYVEQVSFYLVPLSSLKAASELSVDFTGQRTAFGVVHFTKQSGVEGAPAFVRLDEYDSPSDPDMKAVGAVLIREYPDDFPAS